MKLPKRLDYKDRDSHDGVRFVFLIYTVLQKEDVRNEETRL